MLFPKIDTPPRYIDIFQEIFTLSQISYLVCFVLAFKGPNAGVLGNVGNGYWHYQVSTSPLDTFSNLNCDTGRGGLTEWRRKYSSVRHRRPHWNHHLCGALLQDGWIQHIQGSRLSAEGIWNDAGSLTGFTCPKIREDDRPVPQAYLIIHNFCVTIVACALDLTFKFNWVLDAGSGKV